MWLIDDLGYRVQRVNSNGERYVVFDTYRPTSSWYCSQPLNTPQEAFDYILSLAGYDGCDMRI
jgi:hypothetical protein